MINITNPSGQMNAHPNKRQSATTSSTTVTTKNQSCHSSETTNVVKMVNGVVIAAMSQDTVTRYHSLYFENKKQLTVPNKRTRRVAAKRVILETCARAYLLFRAKKHVT